MAKTYDCKLCGQTVTEHTIPKIITKEGLCVECYKARAKALDSALKRFIA